MTVHLTFKNIYKALLFIEPAINKVNGHTQKSLPRTHPHAHFPPY
jgi:hypothetical protein